jgi:hypothetical protein
MSISFRTPKTVDTHALVHDPALCGFDADLMTSVVGRYQLAASVRTTIAQGALNQVLESVGVHLPVPMQQIAQNPAVLAAISTGHGVRSVLDPDNELIGMLCSFSPELDEDSCDAIAEDPLPETRAYLGYNPRTPATVLARLAQDHCREVVIAALTHPNLPITTAVELTHHFYEPLANAAMVRLVYQGVLDAPNT